MQEVHAGSRTRRRCH
uniref:Uncharacterized protein n=1 Tax=Arundo donax TaxID=35708 RepID=A0A0A9BCE3_ARUDO